MQATLFKTLKTGMDGLRKKADKFLQKPAPANIELYKADLERYVQPLNMIAYLMSYAITEAEKIEIETTKAKTRPKKGEKKDKSQSDGWTGLKDKVAVSILNLLELNLATFWSLSYPETEFCLLWTKIAGAMIANPANLKQASLKSNLFMLFAKLVQKYDQSISVAHMINEQLHHHAHVAKAFPPMLEDIANKYDNSKFVGDIVRDVGNADVIALGKDTAAAKNFALFLTNLAALLPRVVLQNVSMFMPHLDAELYTIRNGVIETMGELVLNAFEGDDVKEDGHQTRNKLLECLQDRFMDNNAYCRGKTMDTWARLVEERKVPMNFMNTITAMTVGRLKDKAVAVRKNALRLLTMILRNNAFCPTLKLSELKRRLAVVDARLAEAYSTIVGPTEQQKQQQQESGEEEKEEAPKEQDENAMEVDKENAPSSEVAAAPTTAPAPTADQADTVAKDLLEQAFYKKTIEFAETLEEATHIMCTLLGSKNKTDLQEVIKFFTTAKEYFLESADVGFRKMLHLLWNEEKTVRDAVVKAYKETYLEVKIPPSEPKPQRYACYRMAYNLIELTTDATLSELTSLERLVGEFLREDMIHDGVVDALWSIFGGAGVNGTSRPQESRGAIILLSMVATVKPDTVRDHIDKLARIGLLDRTRWNMDPIFAKFVCITLQKMGGVEGSKYAPDHAIFEKLNDLLLSPSGVASNWCQSTEQVVTTIYTLCDEPHLVMEPIIKSLTAAAMREDGAGEAKEAEEEDAGEMIPMDEGEEGGGDSVAASSGISVDSLSRVLFLVGHVALKELLLVEDIRTEQKQKASIAGRKAADEAKDEKDAMEEEMGMNEQNAALMDEYLNTVMDKHIVCNNLLGQFGPLMQTVLLNRDGLYSHRMLQVTASISLAKFMAVSATFCKANLQLLFTVLERQPDEAIRSNIMIALGDLSYRFPNLIEPWSPSIYSHLQDPSVHVRKTTIMVLSHLILNGVIKIKNNGGLLALAVIDKDPRINEFSRQFFIKLSHTDKGIYNALPDIVSYLSSHKPRLDDDSFRQITQFVFNFIQTDKETESLIEKLCHRFTTTTNVQQWRDIACCLSMLSFSERGIKKLYSCANTYKDICHDSIIYLHFAEMITKSRKAKQTQSAIEVQKIIDESFGKHHPNQPLPSGDATHPKKARGKKAAAADASKRKRGGGRVKTEYIDDDDDDEDGQNELEESSLEEELEEEEMVPVEPSVPLEGEDMVEEMEEEEEEPKVVVPKKKKAAPKSKAKGKKAATAARPRRTGRAVATYVEEEDEDDEDEMEFSDE